MVSITPNSTPSTTITPAERSIAVTFIYFLLSILYEAVEAHEGHGHKARHEEAYREALELIRYM